MQKLSVDKEDKAVIECQGLRSLLTVAAVVIFAVSLGLSVWILRPSDKQLVEVLSDGEVIYSFDLADTADVEFTVMYGGSSNTIQIENGEIWVREAECPDQTCVRMGKLRSENLPIVCLPNRLTIRFAE